MNYRHSFHAGNFADVFKHLLLSRILAYLCRKPAALRFIDTHAGVGRYDLADVDATRTGEWRDGIGRLDTAAVPMALRDLFAPYLAAVGARADDGRPLLYPGSPALAQTILRSQDRILLSEAHPADAVALRRAMGHDRRVTVRPADGYTTLNAALPPPERRGLVLIDPPFEDRDEFGAIAAALRSALRKWASGSYAVWYPIKQPEPVAAFARALAKLDAPDVLWLEMMRSGDEPGLRGCGLAVINPPFVLADEARQVLPVLAEMLSLPGHAPFRVFIRSQSVAARG